MVDVLLQNGGTSGDENDLECTHLVSNVYNILMIL